jgi:molecular chaperone GrpE
MYLPICQSLFVGRHFVNYRMKTETEYVMMKKKAKEQQELTDEALNKPTENKEYSYNPDNNTDKYQADSVSSDSEGSAADGTGTVTGTSDKVLSDGKTPEEKLAEMQDKYIRLSAEFDNYRKRTLREKMELSKHASEDILLKLLPLMDDFERAISHMESSADFTALKNGIDLIYVKFNDFLKQNDLKEIDSLNCTFNVDLHDAVAKIAVEEEDKKGKIIDVVQKGYFLQDKVIRHAKVVVGE